MLELKTKSFPSRNAAGELSRRVVDYLTTRRPCVGTKLSTDADVVAKTQLSHSTVRRALRGLQREGWIERRPGHGSFVGPRVALDSPGLRMGGTMKSQTIRLACVANFARGDWYVAGVLDALDRLAADKGLSIEMISSREDAPSEQASKRLAQSHPDVLALITPRLAQAPLVVEARRLGIPCIATGTSLADIGIPIVCETSAQGAAMGTRHLIEAGHRRIGYLSYAVPAQFVFSRRQGWHQALSDADIPADENLVCWLPAGADAHVATPVIEAYLKQHKPTALLVASNAAMFRLGDYVQATGLRIPQDLSVVTFDQSFEVYRAHFGSAFVPTVVALPLASIAMTIAKYAMLASDTGTIPAKTELPCNLIEGKTVNKRL